MSRKILYSPGFGAGWTSWASDDVSRRIMIDWPPLIEALENGEKVEEDHPAIISMLEKIEQEDGEEPYLGGLKGLTVACVSGKVRINEYDGSESYEQEHEYSGWL